MGEMADLAIDAAMDEWLDHECDDDCMSDGCRYAFGGSRFRVPDDQWKAQGEEPVLIKDLRTNHLLNILRAISAGRIRRFKSYFSVKYDNLKREARRRGILFTRNAGWKQVGVDRRPADEKYGQFTTLA